MCRNKVVPRDNRPWVNKMIQNSQLKKLTDKEFQKEELAILVVTDVFDKWNILKKEVDLQVPDFNFSEKEIWWCSLGKNIGNEQDGKNNNFERPVVILKKWSSNFFIGLPMTSKNKINEKNQKFYFEYDLNESEVGYVILTQIKSLSSKRLIRRMGKMSDKLFLELENELKALLFKG